MWNMNSLKNCPIFNKTLKPIVRKKKEKYERLFSQTGWESLRLKDEIRNKDKITDSLLKTSSKHVPEHLSCITLKTLKLRSKRPAIKKYIQPSVAGNNHSTLTSDANPNDENGLMAISLVIITVHLRRAKVIIENANKEGRDSLRVKKILNKAISYFWMTKRLSQSYNRRYNSETLK